MKIYKKEKQTRLCIVMQRLGKSMQSFIKKYNKKLSLKTIIHISIQLINRLQAVHDLGFVYNDLKPDNILVGNDGLN